MRGCVGVWMRSCERASERASVARAHACVCACARGWAGGWLDGWVGAWVGAFGGTCECRSRVHGWACKVGWWARGLADGPAGRAVGPMRKRSVVALVWLCGWVNLYGRVRAQSCDFVSFGRVCERACQRQRRNTWAGTFVHLGVSGRVGGHADGLGV